MENIEKKFPKWIAPGMLAVGFVGFLDSLFLTINHYSGSELNCNIASGCELVTSSVYSMIGPVPVALLGVAYYLFVIFMIILYLDTRNKKVLRYVGWFTVTGFVMSLYFLFIQAFVLNAFCQYCLVSAATSTTLFIMGITAVGKLKRMV